ncbi:MAG: response regulator [Dehalococcoidia bacterium]
MEVPGPVQKLQDTSGTESITALLVDSNVLLRASLAEVLRQWRPAIVVEEAANGAEALDKAKKIKPDIILMEIELPLLGGIEATRLIKEVLPDTKVIIVTASEEEEDLFAALNSGAHGYLLKSMRPEELFAMLEDALQGEAVISPPLAKRILNAFVEQVHRRAELDTEVHLSPREREVLELASQGATNKEIADQLFISVGTVKNHIHNILEKLHLKNRAQIAAYYRLRRVVGWQ